MAHAPGLTLDIALKRFASGPPLFRDLSLSIAGGSVVALVGPSGIGKSSLLRLVAGLDQDFTGSIAIDGVAPRLAPAAGFVFQDPRLFPWLTTLENIRIAKPGMEEDAARAHLARVGLADRAQAWPHQLSGGMQRRVALARALAVDSGLLLLDEPFVSLDRVLVKDMHQLLAGLLETDHPTTLLVSHLAEDAARLADRVIVLDGRPARVIADLDLVPGRPARMEDDIVRLTREIETLGTSGRA